MTSNEYAKGEDICDRLSQGATQLIDAINNLLDIKDMKDGTGFDLTDNGFETHLGTTDLKFITNGEDFNNVMASAVDLKTWLVNEGKWGVFQKVRRG